MAVLLSDQKPIHAAIADPISADHVVRTAKERMLDPEANAHSASVNDDVVSDQVAVSLFDPDAFVASEDSVSGDHVSAAGSECDATAVSNESVVPYPKALPSFHEHPLVAVVRQQVPLDQAVRGTNGLDSDMDVVPEGAVKDPDVMRFEQVQPITLAERRTISRAVSYQASAGANEREAGKAVPR